MLNDPLMEWEDGPFPYDALAEGGVTPAASMEQVREAAMNLMAQGRFHRAQRAAWDELRHLDAAFGLTSGCTGLPLERLPRRWKLCGPGAAPCPRCLLWNTCCGPI